MKAEVKEYNKLLTSAFLAKAAELCKTTEAMLFLHELAKDHLSQQDFERCIVFAYKEGIAYDNGSWTKEA